MLFFASVYFKFPNQVSINLRNHNKITLIILHGPLHIVVVIIPHLQFSAIELVSEREP